VQQTVLFPGIASNPGILGGKPIIEGTRIPAALILGQLAGGVSTDEIMREYHLSAEQIRAVLSYAAQLVSGETVYATAP
jgi:uncharacterized protein (DUF433 family)